MRGVYRGTRGRRRRRKGSSPHARGLLISVTIHLGDARIIPACAGFTWPADGTPTGPRDHPRMRGVYGERAHDHISYLRIIPACAGFT